MVVLSDGKNHLFIKPEVGYVTRPGGTFLRIEHASGSFETLASSIRSVQITKTTSDALTSGVRIIRPGAY